MTARKTKFEQIPVAAVKKIAKQIYRREREDNVVFENTAAKTEPYAINCTQFKYGGPPENER